MGLSEIPRTILNEHFTEAKSLSDKQVKELEKPFRYRTLIEQIRESMDSDSPDFLSKIIPNYSELSGFVHGGPTARDKLDQLNDQGLRDSELLRIADLTVAMYASAYRWLLMTVAAIRPQFNAPLGRLNQVLS